MLSGKRVALKLFKIIFFCRLRIGFFPKKKLRSRYRCEARQADRVLVQKTKTTVEDGGFNFQIKIN